MAARGELAAAGGRDPALSGFVALIGAWFVATAFIWNRTTAGRVHGIVVGLA